jgi:hypothetical protein
MKAYHRGVTDVEATVQGGFQHWQFEPSGEIKMNITDFKYLDDVQSLLNQRK